MIESTSTFGITTHQSDTSDFSKLADDIAGNNSQAILFCNVHMLMLAQEDKSLADAMQSADLIFADGVPIAWLQSRLTKRPAKVIRGYQMLLAICERANRLGESVGFLGSTQSVMNGLEQRLATQFEKLKISYKVCPPFVEGELTSSVTELQEIRNSGIKWLFVGLGCPKQEKWIARFKHELGCHVLGVGAAFDWISGEVKKPPDWMEKYALAWLYRLIQNPARMWHRYLKYNSKFVLKAIPVWLGRK